MTDKVCSCCGQTLPRELPFGLPLRGKEIAILEMVRKAGQHGIECQRIFDKLYADDIDGGPTSGLKVIHVHVHHINRALRAIGKKIKGERVGRVRYESGKYRLIDVV